MPTTETLLNGAITVVTLSDQERSSAYVTGHPDNWRGGPTAEDAIGLLVCSQSGKIVDAVVKANSDEYVRKLQAALQQTAQALKDMCAGHPVRNVPHCMAAAETLLANTDYEFTTSRG
jgi:hypothetical protein